MTIYLISHDGSHGSLRVTTHANRRDAFTYVNQQCLNRGRYDVIEDAADLPRTSSILSVLAKQVGVNIDATSPKDERSAVYTAIVSKYHSQDHEAIAPPPPIVQPQREEKTMEVQEAGSAGVPAAKAAKGSTKKGGKTAAAKTTAKAAAAKTKVNRAKGKPAGAIGDFTPVKDGSKRAEILKLMDGTRTAAEIGAAVSKTMKVDVPATLVSSNIFCLSRDCAIGHSYNAEGKITALYPKGKSLADALKIAPPPSTPKAKPTPSKAAAKPAVAKKASTKKAAAPAAEAAGEGASPAA